MLLVFALLALARTTGRSVPRGWRLEGSSSLVVTAVGVAAAGVLLEALFRAARLSGLYWFDGWSFWIPKAKAIYFFGGLDERFFTDLPGASYPVLVPTLDAAAFHAIGSPDVVTLHFQYWLFAVGFVWALAGLLAERVPPWILWPFVLLLLLAPRIGRRFRITEADLFLDYLFVLAAVLLALWIVDSGRWRLVVAALLLCAVVNTKREGLLLAACSWSPPFSRRRDSGESRWPALGDRRPRRLRSPPYRGASGIVTRDVEGESGSQGLDPGGRLRPAVAVRAAQPRRALGSGLLEPHRAARSSARSPSRHSHGWAGCAVFVGSYSSRSSSLGGVWATWNFSQTGEGFVLGGNFVIRFMGAAALLCVAAAPLLLSAAWPATGASPGWAPAAQEFGSQSPSRRAAPRLSGDHARRRRPAAVPHARRVLAPGERRCAGPRRRLRPLRRSEGSRRAPRELFPAWASSGPRLSLDACGQWKVFYDGIDSLAAGRGARRAGTGCRLRRTGRARRLSHRPTIARDDVARAAPGASVRARARARPARPRRALPADDPHRHVPQAAVGARRVADAVRRPHLGVPRALRLGSRSSGTTVDSRAPRWSPSGSSSSSRSSTWRASTTSTRPRRSRSGRRGW